MTDDHALVLVAGYQDLDAGRRDFAALTGRVEEKSVALTGAVLVGKGADGKPVLIDTGNHLGRRGAAWGAGLVTQTAPPSWADVCGDVSGARVSAGGCADPGAYVDDAPPPEEAPPPPPPAPEACADVSGRHVSVGGCT